jgi:hypothetical protein
MTKHKLAYCKCGHLKIKHHLSMSGFQRQWCSECDCKGFEISECRKQEQGEQK